MVRTLFASVAVTKYRRCSAAVARDACVITEVRGALFLDFLFLGFYGRVALGCHFTRSLCCCDLCLDLPPLRIFNLSSLDDRKFQLLTSIMPSVFLSPFSFLSLFVIY